MATDIRLTTVDNPHDPFDEFDQWYVWDTTHGYNTLGLLARVTNTSFELSDADQEVAFEEAVDEIVKYNVSGMHRKVVREVRRASR